VLSSSCLALAFLACGASSSPYAEALAAADAKAREHEPDAAAQLYQKAALQAEKPDLAVEALYREASMWKRQGRPERALACLEQLAKDHSASSRGPRIWLDLGRMREAEDDHAGARAAYRQVLNYGDTGLGARAADAWVALSAEPRSIAYRSLLDPGRKAPDLDAFLRLRIARAEQNEGNPGRALATCEDLAKTYPLPRGAYTDDALLLAATLRRQLGDTQGALVTIAALLEAQEKSAIVGSYERAAFAKGRWLAADIHQVDRADPRSAVGVLEDLVRLDSASRLEDDALFRIAWLLGHELGDSPAACRLADRIDNLDPPSALSACRGQICPSPGRAEEPSRRCEQAASMARGSQVLASP
jgi:tetratricopeptide (TPR) repeat protein